jgi:hypothetical protein
MSYAQGGRFRVQSTRDDEGEEQPHCLYDARWDHAVPEQEQTRKVLRVLKDGTQVEVLSYIDGAVYVRLVADHKVCGWLG